MIRSCLGFLGQRAHVRLYKQEACKEAGVTCFMINANELPYYKSFVRKLRRGRTRVVKTFAVVFCILLMS